MPLLQAYSFQIRDAVPINQTVGPSGLSPCRPLCRLPSWKSSFVGKSLSYSSSSLLSRRDDPYLPGLHVRPYLSTTAAAANDCGVNNINTNPQQPKDNPSNKELLTRRDLQEYLRGSQLEQKRQAYGNTASLSDDEEQKVSSFVYDLDDDQWKAAAAAASRVQVIAGPGAGKTRTLLARILILLATGVKPEEIIVVAFTNNAAKELKGRCSAMVGSEVATALNPRTIHQLCRELLRKDGHLLGLDVDFRSTRFTATEEECKQRIHDTLAERKLLHNTADKGVANTSIQSTEGTSSGQKGAQRKGTKERQSLFKIAKAYFNAISQLKNSEEHIAGKSGEELVKRHYGERKKKLKQQQLADIYDAYQKKMEDRRKVDYDDELHHCLSLVREHQDVLMTLHKTWKHILVDEAQDLNKCQHAIFRTLTGPATNLFLVGDPDQNIYGFRGAAADDWQKTFEDVGGRQTVNLVNNYRSRQGIVDAAEEVRKISREVCGGGELEKRQSARQEPPDSDPMKASKLGDQVEVKPSCTAKKEIDWIIFKLQEWRAMGYQWRQMALLTYSVKPSVIAKIVDLQTRLWSEGNIPVYKLEREGDREEQRWLQATQEDSDEQLGDFKSAQQTNKQQRQEQLAMGKAKTTDYQVTASDDAVQLMTLHAAKGKEFPCVAMIFSNAVYYSINAREKAQKTETGQEEANLILNEIRQKYNLVYVGMSRAMNHLCISWHKYEEEPDNEHKPRGTQQDAETSGSEQPHEWKVKPIEELECQLSEGREADKNSKERAAWYDLMNRGIYVHKMEDCQ